MKNLKTIVSAGLIVSLSSSLLLASHSAIEENMASSSAGEGGAAGEGRASQPAQRLIEYKQPLQIEYKPEANETMGEKPAEQVEIRNHDSAQTSPREQRIEHAQSEQRKENLERAQAQREVDDHLKEVVELQVKGMQKAINATKEPTGKNKSNRHSSPKSDTDHSTIQIHERHEMPAERFDWGHELRA